MSVQTAAGAAGIAAKSQRGHDVPARLCGTIDVHKGAVHIARLNNAGRYLLTGGADRQVHLFNAASIGTETRDSDGAATTGAGPTPIKTYSAHTGTVLGLSIAPDNATFASGGEDRNVLLWDVTTGSVVRRLSAHTGAVQVVHFCGAPVNSQGGPGTAKEMGDSVLATAGFDTALRFYDLRARGAWKPIMECKEARDSILCMAMDKHCVYTGSVDGVVRSYDLRAGELREDTFERPITSLTLSSAGTSLLVSTLADERQTDRLGKGQVSRASHVLLDLEDGSHLQTIPFGGANASYRCHSTFCGESESTFVAGDEHGCVRAWDVLSGDEHRLPSIGSGTPVTMKDGVKAPHQRAILWTEYSPKNGGRMVTAGADGMVKVWGTL